MSAVSRTESSFKFVYESTEAKLAKAAVNRHTIMLARPLHELLAHGRNKTWPSFALVVRSIKVLALAIFRWHLCDYILLQYKREICHNIRWKKCIDSLDVIEKQYPYIIESAIFLKFKDGINPHSYRGRASPALVEGIPHNDITEMSVKAIVDYYRKLSPSNHLGILAENTPNKLRDSDRIEIIPEGHAMTISNLLSSKILYQTNLREAL